ncbi:hypothetical protein NIES4071_102190 (plasmid) [Calothrix sp. NIES-4071]|nr:hypothetical protein NIES4071_102190 [Calothrix sp. NIES-4071]BAZ64600.1 hypothetical protein NIES4105_103330 [Calothrix sp. NIES-4105]
MNQYFNSDALKQKAPKHIGQVMPNNDISDIHFQFNTVMQQLSLGMSIDKFAYNHPIKEWVEFISMYTNIESTKYYSTDLSYQFNDNVYLVENYDYIVINDNSVTAFNWSIPKAQNLEWLENSWKTKLRLFLLRENFTIECENISLLYLFPDSKETCQFWYDAKQHQVNLEKIGAIVNFTNYQPTTDATAVENQFYYTAWLQDKSVQEDFDAIPEISL